MPAWKGIVGRGFTAADFEQYVQTIKLTLWHPQFVVLHNTFIPRLADWHQVPGEQRMQNLQHYYRDTQHWSAGPHLFIADDLIWVFYAAGYTRRPLSVLERDFLGSGTRGRLHHRRVEPWSSGERNAGSSSTLLARGDNSGCLTITQGGPANDPQRLPRHQNREE